MDYPVLYFRRLSNIYLLLQGINNTLLYTSIFNTIGNKGNKEILSLNIATWKSNANRESLLLKKLKEMVECIMFITKHKTFKALRKNLLLPITDNFNYKDKNNVIFTRKTKLRYQTFE